VGRHLAWPGRLIELPYTDGLNSPDSGIAYHALFAFCFTSTPPHQHFHFVTSGCYHSGDVCV
jgi:hypothetical protein